MDTCIAPSMPHALFGAGEGAAVSYKDFGCEVPELAMAKPNNIATLVAGKL